MKAAAIAYMGCQPKPPQLIVDKATGAEADGKIERRQDEDDEIEPPADRRRSRYGI
jgi:hypothetical protein